MRSSLLQLHLSVLLLAGSAVMPRYMNDYSASELIQGRSIVAIVALALLAFVLRQSFRINRRDGLWLLLLGVLMAVHWGSYYYALQKSESVAMVTAAFYTFPVMTVFLEPLISWKRLQWQDCVVGGAVLSGVVIMTPAFSLNSDETIYMLLGLFTAFFFALRNVLQRKHMQHMPGVSSMFYQLFVIVACFLVFEWLFGAYHDSAFSPLSLEDALPYWWLWLLLGVCFTAAPHALYLQSLRKLSAKTAGIVACLQPLYAGVLAYCLFTQIPTIEVMVGGVIIVTAAGFESWRATRNA